MIDKLRAILDEYQSKYRRDDVPKLEPSGIYALFPEEGSLSAEVAHKWPDDYPQYWCRGVYVVYGANGECLYIGKASHNVIGRRLDTYFAYDRQDETRKGCRVLDAGWEPRFIVTVAVPHDMPFEASALEEFLIHRLEPATNQVGKRVMLDVSS